MITISDAIDPSYVVVLVKLSLFEDTNEWAQNRYYRVEAHHTIAMKPLKAFHNNQSAQGQKYYFLSNKVKFLLGFICRLSVQKAKRHNQQKVRWRHIT